MRFISIIYHLIIRFVLLLYKLKIFRCFKLDSIVISVGNISWGGTGKTPLVELLARKLKDEGRKIAILSRGYKGADEPVLLKNNLPGVPILIGRNRVLAGREAINRYGTDTIILDDGFQYWRLNRDLNIVNINSLSPFGNKKNILPIGVLREPISSLKRADVFMITKADLGREKLEDLKAKLKEFNPKALIVESHHRPLSLSSFKKEKVDLDWLKGKDICLLSNIADSESFKQTVLKLESNIALKLRFRDHHNYILKDIKYIINKCNKCDIKTIVTTEKDAVWLSKFETEFTRSRIKTLVLRIEIDIVKNEGEFFARLHSLFNC